MTLISTLALPHSIHFRRFTEFSLWNREKEDSPIHHNCWLIEESKNFQHGIEWNYFRSAKKVERRGRENGKFPSIAGAAWIYFFFFSRTHISGFAGRQHTSRREREPSSSVNSTTLSNLNDERDEEMENSLCVVWSMERIFKIGKDEHSLEWWERTRKIFPASLKLKL